MGQTKYQIVLDNLSGVYYPGQVVSGRVELDLAKETKSRAIYIVFKGWAHVEWEEGSGEHKSHYSNKEEYFKTKISLYGKEQTGQDVTKIQPGHYVYQFAFQLPTSIPSSYEDATGRVRYQLKSYIDIPWSFDKQTKLLISVVNMFDLNKMPQTANGDTKTDEKTLCCLCCASDPIIVTLNTDRVGYVPGEKINFRAEINNRSNREIKSSKAKLMMVVSYHATKTRTVKTMLTELVHDKIDGGGSDYWSNESLHIPAVPPSYLEGCSIIDIQYFLTLKVDPSGGLALKVPIELVIGSIPLANIAQQHGMTIPHIPSAPPPSAWGSTVPVPSTIDSKASAPSGLYSDAFMPSNMPNVTMTESALGRMSTFDVEDSQDTTGATEFAPVYTYYNWDNPR